MPDIGSQLGPVLMFLAAAREHVTQVALKIGDVEIHAVLRAPASSLVSVAPSLDDALDGAEPDLRFFSSTSDR